MPRWPQLGRGVGRHLRWVMMTCMNCGNEVSEAERGSVGFLGNIGFLLVAKAPWWPSTVCKKCSRQVRLFGTVCVVVFVVVVSVAVALSWR